MCVYPVIEQLRETVSELNTRLFQVEYATGLKKKPEISNCPPTKPPTAAKEPEAGGDEDDFELFGSDNEEVNKFLFL